MAAVKFTKHWVEALEPAEKRQVFFDSTQPGFALRLEPSGRRAFYVCYRMRGTTTKKWYFIGAWPQWTCEQARGEAKRLMAEVQAGNDPSQALREAKAVPTFETAMSQYKEEHFLQLSEKTIKLYDGYLHRIILPKLGKKRITDISRTDIAEIKVIMKDKPVAWNRCRSFLSTFSNGAKSRRYGNKTLILASLLNEIKKNFAESISLMVCAHATYAPA